MDTNHLYQSLLSMALFPSIVILIITNKGKNQFQTRPSKIPRHPFNLVYDVTITVSSCVILTLLFFKESLPYRECRSENYEHVTHFDPFVFESACAAKKHSLLLLLLNYICGIYFSNCNNSKNYFISCVRTMMIQLLPYDQFLRLT